MDIKTTIAMAKVMPSRQSILFVGKHGIGKSQVARQLAAHFHAELKEKYQEIADLPVADAARKEGSHRVDSFLIDMRLSQQSEGDMIGLPELCDGVTRFCPPEWFMAACREPRLIFLDEINRATPEVMQAAFQVVLDYQLNGYKLHPDTRVYAAVNPDSGGYAVNAMDPALIDRFAVIELEPTLEDWIDWAKGKGAGQGDLLPQVVQFIQANPDFLDPPPQAQPGRKYQSRRSWELLDRAIRFAGLSDCYERNDTLHALALARVGVEASLQFADYVANMEKQLDADDILDKWSVKLQKRIADLGTERYNIIADKLSDHSKENTWTAKQARNVAKYIETLPGEHAVATWNGVMCSQNVENIKKVHQKVGRLIVDHLTNGVELPGQKKEEGDSADE